MHLAKVPSVDTFKVYEHAFIFDVNFKKSAIIKRLRIFHAFFPKKKNSDFSFLKKKFAFEEKKYRKMLCIR